MADVNGALRAPRSGLRPLTSAIREIRRPLSPFLSKKIFFFSFSKIL
jgi:hypothetical protein